jgi:hypothetical protein
MMTTRLQQHVHIDPPPLPPALPPPEEIFYQRMGLCKQIIFPGSVQIKAIDQGNEHIYLFTIPVSYCNLKYFQEK